MTPVCEAGARVAASCCAMGRNCADARNALVSLVLRAVAGLMGIRLRLLTLRAAVVVFLLVVFVCVVGLARVLAGVFFVTGFFLAAAAGSCVVVFVAAASPDVVPANAFPASPLPG